MIATIRKNVVIWGLTSGVAALVISVKFTLSTYPATDNSKRPHSLKVAVVTDVLFSDGGWGTAAFVAADSIRSKYGFQVTTLDDVGIPDIEGTLRGYAESEYDLIIDHGVQWGESAIPSLGSSYLTRSLWL